MPRLIILTTLALAGSALAAGVDVSKLPPPAARAVDFAKDVRPIFEEHCVKCHGAEKQKGGFRLDEKERALKGGDNYAPNIRPGKSAESPLVHFVAGLDPDMKMPSKGDPLTAEQIGVLRAWIDQGAVWPDDGAKAKAHWAFVPLGRAGVRSQESGVSHPIDGFIDAKLAEKGLARSPEADARALCRRLYFDLTGLPPTPEEVEAFLKSASGNLPLAIASLADTLLASPRHGERWAQHWLDVVRYADTDGFEVNTERANAWPYRDYVIRALNDDTPYDRFVREQLAGDATGVDAATGFLVTAAALLPGQIGKDDASIRLARQDSLGEIVSATGQVFLGLSVGCARCHNHKFDPIPQRDYYSMQAFFAGVQYGERPIRDPKTDEARAKEAGEVAAGIAPLKQRLEAAQPPASTARVIFIDDEDAARTTLLKTKNGHGENPKGAGRGYREDAGGADRIPNIGGGRYTWWTNHEGEDVFTWNPGVAGRFRVWLSWGVHGSGVHTRDARYVLDRDGDPGTCDDQTEIGSADQYRFANVAEGESEKVPLWSGLRDAGIQELQTSSRIILRGGKTGTGITADVIVLEEAGAPSPFPSLRAPVNPARNVERFAPAQAKFVRFTTLATIENNRHQPCIDELEIFGTGDPAKNLALAASGARASSSGDYPDIAVHQLPHINDGLYGNSHSWISNQAGGGWVQIELPAPAIIDRIIWSRDREGKFKDRLADHYQIEIAREPGQWVTVARSDDRYAHGTPFDESAALLRQMPGDVAGALKADVTELARLEKRKAELDRRPMVFAGSFTTPEATHLLARGNPEQPRELVAPAVLTALGALTMPPEAADQERRAALASWIASPENPLTARVMVNRIWQGHFGVGLVETASDFGSTGAKPSHPELLDWLASEFIRSGWSMKHMHRLICTSATYRQGSGVGSQESAKADADARLLWRFPARRLDAETIRDSMLAVSGRLDPKMGGPGFNLFGARGGLNGFPPIESFSGDGLRRMIYAHKVRMERDAVFGAFDCPDAGQSTPRRRPSTSPLQALNLFNSRFTIEEAEAFAKRVQAEAGAEPAAQIRRAHRLALGRDPDAGELQDAEPVVREHGLATLCRALFNSNEFLFLP